MSHRPLSILYLIGNCGHGGAEAQIAMQASQVSALGHQVMVAAPGQGWLSEELARRGIAVHSLRERTGKLAPAFWAREIARLVRDQAADVIQSYLFQMNLAGALAGRMTRRPAVASVRGRAYDFDHRRRLWAYRVMSRAGVTFTAPSLDLRDALVRTAGLPPERVVAIQNGVDLQSLDRAFAHPDAEGLPAGFRVATVGRLDPVKGLDHFLDAAAIAAPQAPDMRFVIVGDGPLRTELQARARQLGVADRVAFPGYCDNVAARLPCFDIFVLPSISEGMSNALLEAMAAARPIVATDIGANAEAVKAGQSALLVPPGDAGALAGAIVHLYRDRALATSLGRAAREQVESHFSLARSVAQYLDLYYTLMENRKAPHAATQAAGERKR